MKKTKHVCIGLTNPKGPTNVGAVMRAAGCFQADKVLYTGTRYDRAMRYITDTKDHISTIPSKNVNSLIDSAPAGSSIVCIELVEGAIPLQEFVHPDNAFYVFGPEDGSVEQSVVEHADSVVYVPTIGCLNLAATVNIVLYDRAAKSSDSLASNELIKQSKDRNNKVKIRDKDKHFQYSS